MRGSPSATASPEAGQSVAFDGSSSSDGDGSIVGYAWNFGDGHSATGRTPTHAFTHSGTYTVTLTVVDSDGQHATVTQPVTVLAGPSASFSPSTGRALEGTSIGFDATGSIGGGSGPAITSYAWSFGDGSSGTGATASHTYAAGAYTVKLTVTDAAGVNASATQTVTVFDEAPSALFGTSPAVPTPGQSVTFDGSGSRDSDGAIASYAWDFGDGAIGTGATPAHAFQAAGTYTVKLTVVDRAGQTATVSRSVTVYAQPRAAFSYSPELPVEGVASAFNAAASGADPSTMISSYAWDFGDGRTATGAAVAHTYARAGSYPVTLTVTDGLGMTSSVSEQITVVHSPPVAVATILGRQPVPHHAVVFSGARSYDLGGQILSYLWRFGDHGGGVGKKLTHTFARAGSYRVSLTVRDSFGQMATTMITVRVGRPGPVSKDVHSHRRRRRRHRKG